MMRRSYVDVKWAMGTMLAMREFRHLNEAALFSYILDGACREPTSNFCHRAHLWGEQYAFFHTSQCFGACGRFARRRVDVLKQALQDRPISAALHGMPRVEFDALTAAAALRLGVCCPLCFRTHFPVAKEHPPPGAQAAASAFGDLRCLYYERWPRFLRAHTLCQRCAGICERLWKRHKVWRVDYSKERDLMMVLVVEYAARHRNKFFLGR